MSKLVGFFRGREIYDDDPGLDAYQRSIDYVPLAEPPTGQAMPLELIKAAFAKWIPRLGLAWHDIDVVYYDDPKEIIDRFRIIESGEMVPATVTAQWMYADAKISINLPAFDDIEPSLIERIVVHELCHILVNEMREGEIHHEERVVTGLTKAFLWVDGWEKNESDSAQA